MIQINKTKLALIFSLLWAGISWAIPPEPNEYSLKVNERADAIIEGIVKKRDTVDVSADESYFIYTIDVIYELKDRKNNIDKTVQIILKRDLDWENAWVQYREDNPCYPQLDDRIVFFLESNKSYLLKDSTSKLKYTDIARIGFTGSIYAKAAAFGLALHFTTLQDLYQFIKLLPHTTVSPLLSDFPQESRLNRDAKYVIDSAQLKLIQLRKEYQQKQAPIDEKILKENKKHVKKRSSFMRTSKSVSLVVKMGNPTFIYETTGTRLAFDITLTASETIYLDNFLMRLKYNSTTFGTNIAQNGAIEISRASNFNNNSYSDPNSSGRDTKSDVVSIPFGLVSPDVNPINRTKIGVLPTNFLRVSIKIADCSQLASISFTDELICANLNYYAIASSSPYNDKIYIDDTFYDGTIHRTQMCKPTVTSISPTTITAGTNSKITIKGNGFGTKRGNGAVSFDDADNPINRNKKCDSIDVVSWTDTQVEYIVPSTMIIDTFGVSGTSKITIIENTGKESLPSSQTVTIPYSIVNYASLSNLKPGIKMKYPTFHTESANGTAGTLTFHVTKELFDLPAYYNIVVRAVNEFSCATGINFVLASGFVANTANAMEDKNSVISMGKDSLFRASALTQLAVNHI